MNVARALSPFGWGFSSLVIDESQLTTGRVAITRAAGLLPDGTPFDLGGADELPPPLEVASDLQGELVCLAAPRARFGMSEVDFGDGSADALARYRVVQQDLRDHTHAGDDPEPVELGAVRLRLIRLKETGDAYAALGLVRVLERRSDGQVLLDRGYIPPQTRIDASAQLSATASLLHGLVQQRARAYSQNMGQLGHGVSEVADFLMLQLLNRIEPLLRQFAGSPTVHPMDLLHPLRAMAGELTTFVGNDRLPLIFRCTGTKTCSRSFRRWCSTCAPCCPAGRRPGPCA